MSSIRNFIAAGSLLGASLLPSVASAATTSNPFTGNPSTPAGLVATRGSSSPASPLGAHLSSGLLALGSANDARAAPSAGEPSREASLAQREKAAPELRDFRGGRVYVYLGGGVTLLLVLLLLLILL